MKAIVSQNKAQSKAIVEALGLEGFEPLGFGEILEDRSITQALIITPPGGLRQMELSYISRLAKLGCDLHGV
jgi:hypothetical protein